MFLKTVFVAVLLIGSCQSDIDLPLLTLDNTQQVNTAVQTLCERAGVKDEATITKVKDSGKQFVDCIKQFIDPEVIKNEIEEAKPKGALDEVFKKYCDKSSELKTCIHNLIDSASPCFDQTIRDHRAAATNATEQLIDFVCYKDGDRIALFIAEEGPQCFQAKSTDIQQCGQKLRDSLPNYEAANKLTSAERCAKFDELSSCIVKSLEGCDTPTPANMAESLLRFVRKGSPCPKN